MLKQAVGLRDGSETVGEQLDRWRVVIQAVRQVEVGETGSETGGGV